MEAIDREARSEGRSKGGGALRAANPSPVLYPVARLILRLYFFVFHGLQLKGRRHIPDNGALIIAPNHHSYYDPPMVGLGLRRRACYMAWEKLFEIPWLAWIMRRLGGFPVDPRHPDASAYKQSLRVLRKGGWVVIFPEGERQWRPEVGELAPGVARLALRTGAAVVPAAISGSLEAWPRWRPRPNLFRPLIVKFYPPVRPRKDGALRGEELREEIERINKEIREPMERRQRAWMRMQHRRNTEIPVAPNHENT